jgi:hypothetical protein
MRLVFFCFILVAGLPVCQKEKFDVGSYWNCHQAQNLDSAAVSAKITGTWMWRKQICHRTGKTVTAKRNIRAAFFPDHTFQVMEQTTLLVQGIWNIIPTDGSSFALDLSQESEFLYGRLLFCGNQVLFNDSYRDGCDNLFVKTN